MSLLNSRLKWRASESATSSRAMGLPKMRSTDVTTMSSIPQGTTCPEVGEVRVHVEREAVRGDAPAYPDADEGYFLIVYPGIPPSRLYVGAAMPKSPNAAISSVSRVRT